MIAKTEFAPILGGVALVITAVGGFIATLLNNRRVKRQTENKADVSSVQTLEGLVDRYRTEVERMDEKLSHVESNHKIEMDTCLKDKMQLQMQINELWRAHGKKEGNGEVSSGEKNSS